MEDERQEEIRLGGCGIQRQYNDGSGGRGWELAALPCERSNARPAVIKSLPHLATSNGHPIFPFPNILSFPVLYLLSLY